MSVFARLAGGLARLFLVGLGGLAGKGEFEEFGESQMVLLEELEGPKGFDACRLFGGVGELARGESMFADGDGRLCLVGCVGGGSRMVMRLCDVSTSSCRLQVINGLTLINGDSSMFTDIAGRR